MNPQLAALTRTCDLSDRTERLMLSDEYEREGMLREAELLRTTDIVRTIACGLIVPGYRRLITQILYHACVSANKHGDGLPLEGTTKVVMTARAYYELSWLCHDLDKAAVFPINKGREKGRELWLGISSMERKFPATSGLVRKIPTVREWATSRNYWLHPRTRQLHLNGAEEIFTVELDLERWEKLER